MADGAPGIETDRQLNRVQHSTQNFLFSVVAFVLGAAVGSFLNVCIYGERLITFAWHSGDVPRGIIAEDLGITGEDFYFKSF